jgi:HPt (histidine-containing phosphotransfer) domain-containing protein
LSLLDPRLAWVAGDQAFLEDLLSLFLSETAEFRDTLRTAVAAGNGSAIQNAAHRLKGSLANFGPPATAVKELAAQLERAGTHQQYAEASEIVGQLDTALQALIEKVRTLHAEIAGDAHR